MSELHKCELCREHFEEGSMCDVRICDGCYNAGSGDRSLLRAPTDAAIEAALDALQNCDEVALDGNPAWGGGMSHAADVRIVRAVLERAYAVDGLRGTEDEHRRWALENVRRNGRDERKCGHEGLTTGIDAGCIPCAIELGRREGQVEAGAFLTMDEAMRELRESVEGEQRT